MGESSKVNEAAELRLFFGHQSVGYNILDGVSDITSVFNIIDDTSIPDSIFFFLHSQVGENTKPQTKIDDFAEIINKIGGECDVAFLKFCYIDFNSDTDVNKLFESYKETIDKLNRKYPELKFIHFTTPLTTIQKGPKAFVKRILGRSPWGEMENVQRQKYNELLRDEYFSNGFIFDIAEIESTKPDGSRVENDKDGFLYYSLYEDYTVDGGHLNETGRKLVAENLLELLSKVK